MAESSPIVVVGPTGYVGSSAVKALSAAGATVKAVTRDPASDKAAGLKDLPGVSLAAGSMGDADLADAVRGASVVFLVTPGHIDRAKLTVSAVEACKAAAVPHIVVVSVSTVDDAPESIFGAQFVEIEGAVKSSGVPYTLLRLPLFTDNNFAHVESVKGDGKFYGPADASKPFTSVALVDIADVATAILKEPAAHAGKTYDIVGPAYTHTDLAAAFSSSLGKEVEYVQVPYPAAKEAFMGLGMPEWQVDGVMELYHAVDAGAYRYPSHVKDIIGREATSVQAWVDSVKGAFQ